MAEMNSAFKNMELDNKASTQMVVEVFGNCVTMLEEMKRQRLKLRGIKPTERSDHSKFDYATAPLATCIKENTDRFMEELKKVISQWSSSWGEHKLDLRKMSEMLETGHTAHPMECDQPSNNGSTGLTGQGHQHRLGTSPGYDEYQRQYSPHEQTFVHGEQANAQTQKQLLRSVQASKQMVYEVFGNCVIMLEELEHRELKLNGIKPTERSDIHLPDQSKFDDATIQRKLDAQLLMLKVQLVSCNEEIKDSVKEELKKGILHWASGRGEHIPNGTTDLYAAKMFELLDTGHTEYPMEFDQPPKIGEKDMPKAMQGLIQGQHHQAELDRKFKENPDKEAEAPKIRKSKGIDKGADRVAKAKPKTSKSVDNYRKSLR